VYVYDHVVTWVGVGIWSCDKLSYKSPYETRHTIEARYEKGYSKYHSYVCFMFLLYYPLESNYCIFGRAKFGRI